MSDRFALVLFCLLSSGAWAQNRHWCGADELRIKTLSDNPSFARTVAERQLQLDSEAAQSVRGGGPEVYVIPVVFHVIHKFGNENISKDQILDGLSVLNETFRKTRSDTVSIVAQFKPIHADCGIEFKLATRDPDGNCHPGINRIASGLTITGGHAVKELVHWDPTRYLNIYVVTNAAGLAGHAVWPADADTIPEWDGIVISHDYMGSIGTSNPLRSVVLAHECGHYLNLHHIWGGNNVPGFYYLPVGDAGNCQFDDLVDDTPNTIGNTSCDLQASSCGNLNNVQNAMDYSYCNIMFTQGQRDRMRSCLESSIAGRNNLWQPANLASTGVDLPAPLCAADFEADIRVVCPGASEQVSFIDQSYHAVPSEYQWQFDGGSPTTANTTSPVVSYELPGVYPANLTVSDGTQSYVETKEDYITVLSNTVQSVPFTESFEGTEMLDGPLWNRFGQGTAVSFEQTGLAAVSGANCVMVDRWAEGDLTIAELYSPPIDLTGAADLNLTFKWAASGSVPISTADKLQVYYSSGCGSTWSQRWSKSSSQLQTAAAHPDPFIPQAGHWPEAVLGIPQQYLTDEFRFKFVYSSAGYNRLLIDDINLDVNAGLNDRATPVRSVSLSPHPTNEMTHLSFYLDAAAQNMTVALFDLTGREVQRQVTGPLCSGANKVQVPLSHLLPGTYVLLCSGPEWRFNERVVVVR